MEDLDGIHSLYHVCEHLNKMSLALRQDDIEFRAKGFNPDFVTN